MLHDCRGGGGGGEKGGNLESANESASSRRVVETEKSLGTSCGVKATALVMVVVLVVVLVVGLVAVRVFGDRETGEDGVRSCNSSLGAPLRNLRRFVFGTEPLAMAKFPQHSLELRRWRSCSVSLPTVA